MSSITVTADDYGLSRGNTDTILETADRGALTCVSLLPNGLAFEYAAGEYKERSGRLKLSAHLNLTEGKPLSRASEVPHLVDARGYFKHSPASLFLATVFSGSRSPIRGEIRTELRAQLERVRSLGLPFSADGHQHIHMVPAVFSELLALAPEYGIRSVRVPYEPVGLSGASLFHPFRMLQVLGLNVLSMRNLVRMRGHLTHNDFFLGVLHSGALDARRVGAQLRHVPAGGTLELGTHPGSALPGELSEWSGDTQWHYSKGRTAERDMLLSDVFKALLASGVRGTHAHLSRVARFILSGSVAAAVHLSLLFVLTEYAGLWYLLSATIGWCVAFVVSFMLQRFFTFDDRSALHGAQALRYFALQVANLVLNTTALFLLTSAGLWYMASQFVVLILLAAWSYFISSRMIFALRSAQ